MRVLVYPHDLGIGGSQINAIELAAAMQHRGHQVTIFGRPGPLNPRIAELGLEFVESPEPRHRPSLAVARALRNLISTRNIDVVHGYEWPPALEARLAAARSGSAVAVATVMSMSVAPFIPRAMPVFVGTEQILAQERRTRGNKVGLLEPPVDLEHNVPPSQQEIDRFTERWKIHQGEVTAVIVGRLARELKFEGLCAAMEAFNLLARSSRVRLLLVGGGPAQAELEARAEEINTSHGRPVVTLTGELIDPRVAYSVADIAIGMGSSALRAMAFGLPLIVQGEQGYFRLLDPGSAADFFWHGWYGIGDVTKKGSPTLMSLVSDLAVDAKLRNDLGQFGRGIVENRYSIEAAATRQLEWYRHWSAGRHATRSAGEDMASAFRWAKHHGLRRIQRYLGVARSEDFNSPVTIKSTFAAPPGSYADRQADANRSARESIVYLASVSWDSVPGTDRRLAEELANRRHVLWVDPPKSLYRSVVGGDLLRRVGGRSSSGIPGVSVLRPLGPPGVTRPIMRDIAWTTVILKARVVSLAIRTKPVAIIGARLPPRLLWSERTRFLHYMTDDFTAGASLMGKSGALARREQAVSMNRADLILAVSDTLARRLELGDKKVKILPNGCSPDLFGRGVARKAPPDMPPSGRIVGLVGQLNERLDMAILHSLAESNIRLVIIGPRTAVDSTFQNDLDRLLAHRNVTWLGTKRYADLPAYLAAMNVGITPYLATPFNEASCPLKTLEYLSAGLPVVSTMDPDFAELDSSLISVEPTARGFIREVLRWVENDSAAHQGARLEFARRNSWSARADEVLEAIS